MRSCLYITITVLLTLSALCSSQAGPDSAKAGPAAVSSVSFSVSDKGLISVSADLLLPHNRDNLGDVFILALPIPVSAANRITAPSDVHISHLTSGSNYTMLVVACPRPVERVHFAVQDGLPISETLDGKGKVEFDLSYSLMSQFEKSLMSSPTALSNLVFEITLPRKYDDADVAVSTPTVVRKGDRLFDLSLQDAQRNNLSQVWISFPNPSQQALSYAKVAFSMLLGLFAAAIQFRQLRDRRFWWFVFVFLLSSMIVAVAGYFYYHLSKGLDFLVFSAAAVPSAVYAAVACVYLAIAKKWQATIGGQVNINGAPGKYVTVSLLGVDTQNRPCEVDKTEALLEGGRYHFNIWLRGSNRAYQVKADFNRITQQSKEFQVHSGKATEVPVLEIDARLQPAAVP